MRDGEGDARERGDRQGEAEEDRERGRELEGEGGRERGGDRERETSQMGAVGLCGAAALSRMTETLLKSLGKGLSNEFGM